MSTYTLLNESQTQKENLVQLINDDLEREGYKSRIDSSATISAAEAIPDVVDDNSDEHVTPNTKVTVTTEDGSVSFTYRYRRLNVSHLAEVKGLDHDLDQPKAEILEHDEEKNTLTDIDTVIAKAVIKHLGAPIDTPVTVEHTTVDDLRGVNVLTVHVDDAAYSCVGETSLSARSRGEDVGLYIEDDETRHFFAGDSAPAPEKAVTKLYTAPKATVVNEDQFKDQTHLQNAEIHIASSVTEIKANAFANSVATLDNVRFAEDFQLTKVGAGAFAGAVTETLTISAEDPTLEEVGENAFGEVTTCKVLNDVTTLANLVASIPDGKATSITYKENPTDDQETYNQLTLKSGDSLVYLKADADLKVVCEKAKTKIKKLKVRPENDAAVVSQSLQALSGAEIDELDLTNVTSLDLRGMEGTTIHKLVLGENVPNTDDESLLNGATIDEISVPDTSHKESVSSAPAFSEGRLTKAPRITCRDGSDEKEKLPEEIVSTGFNYTDGGAG